MGFFDKIFSGLSKTRGNLEELEELFQDYAPDNSEFYDELEKTEEAKLFIEHLKERKEG